MGADFIWGRVEVTEPKSTWLNRILEADIAAFAETTEDDYYWSDSYEEDGLVEGVTEELRTAIEICYGYHQNREMGWFIEGDRTYALTGGMSWGDDPTEALRDIWLFDSFQRFFKEAT